MKRARPAALLLISAVGVLLFAPPAASGLSGSSAATSSDDERAVTLLRRASLALDQVSYRGSRIVSSWGGSASITVLIDIRHVAGQGTLVQMRGGVSDDTAAFLAAGEDDGGSQPGLGVDSVQLLTESYDVWTGTSSRVAGRRATVVEIGHAKSVVARIWVDDRTGLPLRKEVFDAQGRLATESAFLDLEVERDGFIAHLPPSPPHGDSDRLARAGAPGLGSHGWSCPQEVGDLRLVGVDRTESTSALHTSYSDGLFRVSVFEQRGSLDERQLTGFSSRQLGGATVQMREGMPTYVVWEDRDTVYTVVTDAPIDTVARVVEAYPHGRSEPGFWDRVSGGFGRLGAWATPLV